MASKSDLVVESPTRSSTPPDDVLIDRRSIYQKFCMLRDDEVAKSWKAAEGHSSKEKQHGDFVLEQISSDFFEWVEKVKLENLRINVETLKELFQVGMANPSALSLHSTTKEMPFVPKSIARSMNNYEKYERAVLHRQLLWDVAYENMFKKSKKRFIKSDWFFETSSKEALTGSTVWDEKLLAEVRKGICSWLRKCPQYKRPASLEQHVLSCADTGERSANEIRDEGTNFWIFDSDQYRKENEEFKKSLPTYSEIGIFWEDA